MQYLHEKCKANNIWGIDWNSNEIEIQTFVIIIPFRKNVIIYRTFKKVCSASELWEYLSQCFIKNIMHRHTCIAILHETIYCLLLLFYFWGLLCIAWATKAWYLHVTWELSHNLEDPFWNRGNYYNVTTDIANKMVNY